MSAPPTATKRQRIQLYATVMVVLLGVAVFCLRQQELLALQAEAKRQNQAHGGRAAEVRPAEVGDPPRSDVPPMVTAATQPKLAAAPARRDPESARFLEAADRAAHISILEDLYGDLISRLGLTGEERSKFMSRLVEERRSAIDAVRLARITGINDHDALGNLVRDAAISEDSDLLALLGEQRFNEFAEYRSTSVERTTVRLLQAELAGSGDELSPAQADNLMQVYSQIKLQEHSHFEVSGLLNTIGIPLDDGTITALSSGLTKPQADALKQLRDEQTEALNAQKEYAKTHSKPKESQ